MRSKVCDTRSDLPITTKSKVKRQISRASFSSKDAATDILPEIKGVMDVLKSMQVKIPQVSEVSDYLLAHRDMSCLLPPVCSKLTKLFGENASLSLEVYRDPEINDGYLTLYVRQSEYKERFLDNIDEAMAEFEPMLAYVSGWLLVTTDFHPLNVNTGSFRTVVEAASVSTRTL
jgi:hypothetical protein